MDHHHHHDHNDEDAIVAGTPYGHPAGGPGPAPFVAKQTRQAVAVHQAPRPVVVASLNQVQEALTSGSSAADAPRFGYLKANTAFQIEDVKGQPLQLRSAASGRSGSSLVGLLLVWWPCVFIFNALGHQ